ncbi:hypothetical protein BU23DRAFT_569182 [Bimuria novae-zelandiae CBS 107.79]|uniref:Uncharacterized protein n=1 Tax=Bimuria novae-zelandiae CBS 107.79 TaxID=1447943 RepID=A0A6A5VGI6_9PLEO|nr:hypothetical protein BU23DRAFT_569182 [Bimuria novae-zelandiae CBS 107.79]
MHSDSAQTFECTICGEKHKVVPDTLPTGHSGHKAHCLFCLLHTFYRSIIPAAPTTRLTGEQVEKNNIIRTRKIVLATLAPVIVLAYFAFRWQMHLWHRLARGFGEGDTLLHDHFLFALLCIIAMAPCGFILGFIVSVVYYMFWYLKKKREKCRKSDQDAGAAAADAPNSVPLEEKPLTELRYQDLREMNKQIQIVVTPPDEQESPPTKENRMSKMLGAVTERFKNGYDGRGTRKEGWIAMEDMDGLRPRRKDRGGSGKHPRPMTEWPEM